MTRLSRALPDPHFGHRVRRLQLPTSSKIVPRPAAIIRASFASRITLTANDLGPAMISAVKHAASIRNPEFDARQRARRSTWDTPRFLYSYDETAEGDLVLPRGLYSLLAELVDSAGSALRIEDNRSAGDHHEFTCATQLRTEQTAVVRQLIEQDTSVLIAPPGTGKTVIACAAIALRATSTLILVDRKALADQWRDRLQKHVGFKCGLIGGGRSKTTGIVDVALLPTLARRASVEEITANYGFVIVDECHHVAASAFFHVLNRIPPARAKNRLGAATTTELSIGGLAASAAGVEGVGVHTLRHSAAVDWLESGVHIKAVADLLGQSSVAITGDVYGHTSDDTACAAVDGLAGRLGL